MDELFVTTVVTSWKQIVNRLDERFARLDDEQLQKQIAPNKNRLFYLLGHLTAVHDRMLPLLGIGKRLHPDLDEAYLTNPDQTFSDPLSAADLKKAWSEVNAAITLAVEKFSVDDWLRNIPRSPTKTSPKIRHEIDLPSFSTAPITHRSTRDKSHSPNSFVTSPADPGLTYSGSARPNGLSGPTGMNSNPRKMFRSKAAAPGLSP